jgi:adenylate cyclase
MMTRNSFRFESFTLDLERLCLRGPSGQVDVRRKSFDVLRYLIEHAGRVVTKEELIGAVWPDVTVGDESLTQCISEVRRALDDEGQRIIRTVPRRGYLIGVPVSADDTTAVQTPIDASALSESSSPGRPLPDRASIAVLPLANLGHDPQLEYFADGIAEDIITDLSRFSELFVIARNSSFQYKGN